MEVPLPMLHSLDKALLLRGYTNPRMQALRGRRDKLSTWTSSVWQRMETTCSQATCLALITQSISGKAGLLVILPGTARLVAASSLTHLEVARFLLVTRWGCSYQRAAVQRGSQSMKVFRNARSPMSKLRALIVTICLPVPRMKVFGESYWELERRRLHQVQLRL